MAFLLGTWMWFIAGVGARPENTLENVVHNPLQSRERDRSLWKQISIDLRRLKKNKGKTRAPMDLRKGNIYVVLGLTICNGSSKLNVNEIEFKSDLCSRQILWHNVSILLYLEWIQADMSEISWVKHEQYLNLIWVILLFLITSDLHTCGRGWVLSYNVWVGLSCFSPLFSEEL